MPFERFRAQCHADPVTGLAIDASRLGFERADFARLEPELRRAMTAMQALEAGAIANPDENRRVGHYWLRAPELAPDGLGDEIDATRDAVCAFAARVRTEARFRDLLLIGIGGSALGPQLLADALAEPGAGLGFASLDNTDPDGIARVLARLDLAATLFVVTSKSGGTKETRNGMLEAQAACARAGIDFARQAVAITGRGSALDELAQRDAWLARFAMWDWVGGRTSVCSAVGLLPGALCGIDVAAFLDGARAMDAVTRATELDANPAARLAAAWFLATAGRGERDMVVLPYRDRLVLLGRYLQQLVMESLGKSHDVHGNPVAQGIAVYGNKGSTDQHAYVQQLRDGVDNFFVSFVRVLDDGHASNLEVEPGVTSADYLQGFWLGTRAALAERGRPSLTITLPRLDAWHLGALIALFERTVGLYASLAGINAYDQPGVEAGKRAAGAALELRARILAALAEAPVTAEALAAELDADAETCFLILEHLAANRARTGVLADGARFSRPAAL